VTNHNHTTSALALVDITSVHADAVRVKFSDVRKGDWVFDAWGERHKLVSARVIKHGVLSIKRDDYPSREYIYPDQGTRGEGTMVIVPEHGWTQDGHGYRSVYENGKRVGGEFYETCRCGQTFGSGPAGDESSADYLLRKHADEANGRVIYDA
jgi:hypothetical protein